MPCRANAGAAQETYGSGSRSLRGRARGGERRVRCDRGDETGCGRRGDQWKGGRRGCGRRGDQWKGGRRGCGRRADQWKGGRRGGKGWRGGGGRGGGGRGGGEWSQSDGGRFNRAHHATLSRSSRDQAPQPAERGARGECAAARDDPAAQDGAWRCHHIHSQAASR